MIEIAMERNGGGADHVAPTPLFARAADCRREQCRSTLRQISAQMTPSQAQSATDRLNHVPISPLHASQCAYVLVQRFICVDRSPWSDHDGANLWQL